MPRQAPLRLTAAERDELLQSYMAGERISVDALVEHGIIPQPGSVPRAAGGASDIDILRGRSAIPGVPLQADTGPARLPPWAELARSATPIGGVDEAARSLAEAEAAGNVGQGASALARGGLNALPITRAGRLLGGGIGALAGAGGLLAPGETEAQSASVPIDDGLTPELRARRSQLLSAQQQRGGLKRAERTELEGLNAITSKHVADKNAAAIEDEREQKRLDREAAAAGRTEEREQMSRSVKAAETTRDAELGAIRPEFERMFPNWAAWQHALPIGLGAAIGAFTGGKAGLGQRAAAGRWQEASDEATRLLGVTGKGAKAAEARAALPAQIAAQHAENMPVPTIGNQAASYALPGMLGAAEGAAMPHMGAAYDAFLPALNPERLAWEKYRNSLPDDHPDLPRAQKIIESLEMRNPHQLAGQEYFTDLPRLLTRTGIGVAEGAGGATFGKTMGGMLGKAEGALPRAETQAILMEMERRRQLVAAAAAAKAAKRRGANP